VRRQLSYALLVGGIVAACAPTPTPSPTVAPTPARTTIKIVNLPFIAFAPFYIATEEGLFQQQGIEPELVNMATQPDTLAALVAGQVDVVGGQLSAGTFNFIARGGEARIVADKGYIDPNSCDTISLIARRGLFPPDTTPSRDVLQAKKFSVVPGSWNDYLADKLLAAFDLTTTDFADNVQLPSTSDLGALDNAQIDLLMQNEPWVTRLGDAGHTPFLSQAHLVVPDAETAVMLYGSRLLGANAELGNRFMVAYLQGVRQYNEGKTDRNVAILAQYTQLEPDLLRRMCWPTIRGDGAVNVQSVLDFQSWAAHKGLIPTSVAAEQLIDTSFAAAANQRLAGLH
jgi:ABC-type nitrate/sulfonate/bicarbonate transport system substrate-binding protein